LEEKRGRNEKEQNTRRTGEEQVNTKRILGWKGAKG